MVKTKGALLLLGVLILLAQITVVHGQDGNGDFQSLIASLFASPTVLITFFIEFALGIGLGYLSVKVAKYIIALLAIFIVGVFLNVWQSGTLQDIVGGLNLQWTKVYPVIQALLIIVGLTTVLPVTLGFVIGFVVGIQR
ncbi:hypothetical protein AC480_02990 [miscellaneous Crenarchaeota group archaeon SMTZ1-55]|jgi:hypothetical protein|nr:MAG: hypothetical protein AC480_02990 [miscellaneous Crenarchaeota group archaeon SMTZ1-55]